MPNKQNHYIYQIKDIITNQFYIGVRSCDCNPCEDSYMGSYSTWNPDEEFLEKSVIAIFDERDIANEYEKYVIENVIDNELNQNYHIPSVGFHTLGRQMSEEEKQSMSRLKKEYWKNNKHPLLGNSHSEETKEKIRNALSGRKLPEKHKQNIRDNACKYWLGKNHSEETKEKISKWSKEWHENNDNGFLGKTHTKEARKKMSESKRKKVYQYDLDGNFIREWISGTEAEKQLGIYNISKACNGKLKTVNGYKWSYKKLH